MNKLIIARTSILSVLLMAGCLFAATPVGRFLTPNSVRSEDIQAGAVGTASLEDNSVTPTKLDRSYVETVGDTMTGQLNFSGGALQHDISLTVPAHSEGLVYYDKNEKAISHFNEELDVTINLGQEMVIRVVNETGSTILDGKAVHPPKSSAGGLPSIELAKADDAVAANAIGLATHDIEAGTTGYVTAFGIVRNLDTSSFSVGDKLFLSDSSAGELVNTAPLPPSFEVQIGIVIVSDASNGKILVSANQPILGATADNAVLSATQTFTGSNAFANPVTIVGSSLTVNGDLGVDSPTLFVDSTADRVGIGTTNPEEVLHVSVGNILIDNDRALKFKDNAGAIRKALTVESTDDMTLGSSSFDDMIFKVGTLSEAVRIKEVTGNVGIGTISPAVRLDVNGSTLIRSTLTVTGNAFSVGASTLVVTNGRVGIGTNSPSEQLDVAQNAVVGGSMTASAFFGDGSNLSGVATAITTAAPLKGDGSSGDPVTLDSASNVTIATLTVTGDAFSVGASTLVVTNGRVGIGTTAPGSALDVNGQIRHTTGIISEGVGTGTVVGNARGSGAIDLQTSRSNAIQVASGNSSVIGGGRRNVASGEDSIVGGGLLNTASGKSSTVVGGESNLASAQTSFIGGGSSNEASGQGVSITGGSDNTATGSQSTIGGGRRNTASNISSTIGGGEDNTVASNYATVPGGLFNSASGDFSFAAGRQAKATANGSFVWADSRAVDCTGSTIDGVKICAQGGVDLDLDGSTLTVDGNVGIGTTSPSSALHVSSAATSAATPILIVSSGTGTDQELLRVRADGNVGIGTTSPSRPLHIVDDSDFLARFESTDGFSGISLRDNSTTAGDQVIVAAVGDAMRLRTLNTDRMAITSAGNVGIATVIPAARLHVSSSNAVAADTILQVSSGTATGQELLVVKGDGNVGIGTASPAASALLDMVSTTKGLLIPRVTTAQKDAISSPAIGLQVFDTSKETKVVNTTIGWKDMGAGWYKFTLSHTAFQTAGLTNDIELFSLPAGGTIERVMIKQSTAFAGTSISAYTISVGISGDLAKYASAFDVLQAVSDTTFQLSHNSFMENFGAATSVRIAAIAVGANLDQSTVGAVEVWVQTSVLQ